MALIVTKLTIAGAAQTPRQKERYSKMDTREFFQELFEHKPEDEFVIVWSLPSKETRRFRDLDKAADHIEQLKEAKADVYVGCGLQSQNLCDV